ncbi:MAG: hypothetical protein Q9187_000963 [Circinaria calcarea]
MAPARMPSSSTALPFELLCSIITSTRDAQTLDSWCIASKSHPSLHRVAMGVRWARVSIAQADFILPPEDRGPFYTHHPLLLIDRITGGFDNVMTSQLPASYIKQLNLSFQFQTPSSFMGEEGHHEYVLEDLPCSEDLQYSLITLLPNCTALSEIDHEGVLHQENLDQITNLVKPPLHTLRLRKTPPRFPARWRHPHPPYGVRRDGCREDGYRVDFEHMDLRWGHLVRLRLLRTLEISQLFPNEGITLAKVIGELGNLERLLLVTAQLHPAEADMDVLGGYPSHLNGFLSHVFPANHSTTSDRPSCKLPPRLRSLALSDPNSRNVFVNEPSSSYPTTYSALTEIFLDIDNLTALGNIFKWLQMPALERFAVPAVITIPALDPWVGPPGNEDLILVDTAYPDLVGLINSLIQRHEATLQQVTLFNAWQEGGEDGSGTVRELSHDCFYRLRRAIDGPGWGSDLQRLRIDQLDFDGLVLDGFATPELAHLKLLMLYPWSLRLSSSNSQKSLPADMNSFNEGRIALGIISENLPRLRVLVIGGYQFWVERSPAVNATDDATVPSRSNVIKTTTKLWHFLYAQKDAQQRLQIAHCLLGHDWSFLNEIPAHPRKDDSRAIRARRALDGNYLFGRRPSLQMRKHRNYMVLSREDPDAEIQTRQQGQRSFRHERELIDLATWHSFNI